MLKPINIKIDTITKNMVTNYSNIRKGDTLKLTINIFQNSSSLTVANQTIRLILRKPDGYSVEKTLAGSGNSITVLLDEQATVALGEVKGEIHFTDSDGTSITNWFTYEVEESLADDVVIASKDSMETLEKLIDMLDTNTIGQVYNASLGYDSLDARLDGLDIKNKQYKKSIFKQLPLSFADYNTIITQESVSYIYPQSFTIDWASGEIFVVYNANTQSDTIKKWVVVFELSTSSYKSCFHAGFGLGEGIVVKYESGLRYLYVKSTGTKIGKYDISTLPTNLSSVAIASEFDVGLFANFSYRKGVWLIEQGGAPLGINVKRTNFSLYDDSFQKTGSLNIGVGNTGAWTSDLADYLCKRQGLCLGDGFIVQSMGGMYREGDITIPYNHQGIRILDMKGDLVSEGLMNPNSMITNLENNGISCTRVESEGVHVDDNNEIYSMTIKCGVADTGSTTSGIIIFKEFSNEPSSLNFVNEAINSQSFNHLFYETGIFPRSGDGKMYNPLTGEPLDTFEKILDFMIAVDLKQFLFYSTSVSITDISGNLISDGALVKIINANNNTFIVEYVTSSNNNVIQRIYGETGARNVVSNDTGWIQLTLLNSLTNYAIDQSLSYRKIGNRVTIRGAVTNITVLSTIVSNLPSGYRPLVSHSFAMPGSDNRFNRFTIGTDGNITFENTSYTGSLSSSDWYPINTSFLID